MKSLVKFKAVLSLTLLTVFVLLFFTGLGLHFAPSGRVAMETSWTFLGLSKWKLEDLHTMLGFLFSALVVIHFSLNWNMFKAELRALFK